MVLPTPTALALTLLLVAPFQWFTVAAAKTFRIPQFSNSGATLGGMAFLLGTSVVLWQGLFAGLDVTLGAYGAVFSVLSLVLYEWARRTVVGRRFSVALAGDVPEEVCESGPYRYFRHPFYLSYIIASLGMLVATSNRNAGVAFVCNMGLFIYMARDDEQTLEASALGKQYTAYKQRVGVLLLLPHRQA
jgi:protein-S-isoprenylcysteine O-methyltransferase Ste14